MRPCPQGGQRPSFYPRNPIITVTEHTPTPSPDYLKRQVKPHMKIMENISFDYLHIFTGFH